jgi:membrane-bound acyltransferase YfiQ involved in biofilm formation
MSSTNLQDLLIFAWAAIWFGWAGWFLLKIYRFDRKTRRQAAISKPQLYDLSKVLVVGTALATFLMFMPIFFGKLIVPDNDTSLVQVLQTISFCFLALLIFVFFALGLQLMILRNLLNFPLTNQRDVPIQGPPKPLPYAGKSFEQLSKELDDSLGELKE